MSPNVEKSILNPVEQQIIAEEEKYQKAFKADAEFQVLKNIRQTINRLKLKLAAQSLKRKD